jgi:arylsulfatase A-like enzyme
MGEGLGVGVKNAEYRTRNVEGRSTRIAFTRSHVLQTNRTIPPISVTKSAMRIRRQLTLFASFSFAIASAAAAPPNIVIIVADDLGWADVGYHGSDIRTPHIDALARGGVELDQFYVAPMCTPTRAALLTGRYWSRFGNNRPSNEQVLPFETITLARALQSAGYETQISGKWHLGSLPESEPRRFGFDHSYGCLAGGCGPYNHLYKHEPYVRTWHRNGERLDEEGHVTDLITEDAVRFLEQEHDKAFFLYVPFTAVHTPIDEPQEWLEAVSYVDEDRRLYAADVAHLDHSIGRIVQALDEKALRENTLIIFFSDNGGTRGDDTPNYPGEYPTSPVLGRNTPLRGWKGQLYEGGIRVPAIVNSPSALQPRKVTAPLHVVDIMPTLCGLAAYEMEEDLSWDGHDVWRRLSGELTDPPPRTLYWQGVGKRSAALRDGDWKLVVHYANDGDGEEVELFNLADDPFEEHDLAGNRPADVARLQKLLAAEASRDEDAVASDRSTTTE